MQANLIAALRDMCANSSIPDEDIRQMCTVISTNANYEAYGCYISTYLKNNLYTSFSFDALCAKNLNMSDFIFVLQQYFDKIFGNEWSGIEDWEIDKKPIYDEGAEHYHLIVRDKNNYISLKD